MLKYSQLHYPRHQGACEKHYFTELHHPQRLCWKGSLEEHDDSVQKCLCCMRLLVSQVATWHSPSRPVIRQAFPHKSTEGQRGGKVLSRGSNGSVFHGDQENDIPHEEKGKQMAMEECKERSLCVSLWGSLWFRRMFCTKVATVQWLFSISSGGSSWLLRILFTSTLTPKKFGQI